MRCPSLITYHSSLKAREGFTLIEVLVVVTVTIVLSAVGVAYSRTSERTTALFVERAKVGQLILKAKALTLSTKKRDTLTRPCGYGVWIDYDVAHPPLPPNPPAPSLHLFSYSLPSGGKCSDLYQSPPDLESEDRYEVVESLALDPNVRFGTTASRKLDVVLFVSPDPTTLIWVDGEGGQSRVNSSGRIPLETISGSARTTVLVTTTGEVSFGSRISTN